MAIKQETDIRISIRHLWKVFGPEPSSILDQEWVREATRAEILERTGHVIGVKDVSFEVKIGEVFVVMGLSGSGKSTLIRCLIRLVEPTSGAIEIDGEDIVGYHERQMIQLRREKVGIVFQQHGLLPHRRVLDNVAYGLEVKGLGKKSRRLKAEEVIETVGLSGWEDAFPSQLSGGMQQRVGIARALAVDPEVLLMDEPFSGLDPLIRREMQDELINLQAKVQKTIVFITHDLNESLKLGDHIAIMRDGEIVQQGTPQQIVTQPANEYVSAFVQDVSKAKVLSAENIMQEPAALVYDWQKPEEALKVMQSNGTENVLVIDRSKVLCGYLTISKVEEAQKSGISSLLDAVTTECPQVSPGTIVEDIVALAAQYECPVAVIDGQGHLLGEVQRAAILNSVVPSVTGTEDR